MSKQILIPAVAYVRKSTKGERLDRHGKRRERQEKSLQQQKEEIVKVAQGRFEILKWFEDEGISGWKRGPKRPSFQNMLAEVQGLGAKVVVCDKLDRFTRATNDDVQEDATALRKAGVRWIITSGGAEYDLEGGKRNDIAAIIIFAAAVCGAHQFCKDMSRRVILRQVLDAKEGKRSGGRASYGLKDDGNRDLIPDPKTGRHARWIFEQVGNPPHQSLHWIRNDLNARKVPSPTGGRWCINTIRTLLRRRCYMGDFEFNKSHAGHFFGINHEGEVVEASELNGERKVFTTKGKYKKALIDADLFERVQKRLDLTSLDHTRRKRMGYALTGILFCGECGSAMYGTDEHPGGTVIYRCSGSTQKGRDTCGHRRVKAKDIEPFILRMLGEKIQDLKNMRMAPPNPVEKRKEAQNIKQEERDHLARKIDQGVQRILDIEDRQTRQTLDGTISQWREDLAKLDAELMVQQQPDPSEADAKILDQWWNDHLAKAVAMPLPPSLWGPRNMRRKVMVDSKLVNEALFQVGAQVYLWWKPVAYKTKGPKAVDRKRFILWKGRFRLGEQSGQIPRHVLNQTALRCECRCDPGAAR